MSENETVCLASRAETKPVYVSQHCAGAPWITSWMVSLISGPMDVTFKSVHGPQMSFICNAWQSFNLHFCIHVLFSHVFLSLSDFNDVLKRPEITAFQYYLAAQFLTHCLTSSHAFFWNTLWCQCYSPVGNNSNYFWDVPSVFESNQINISAFNMLFS